MTTKYYSVTLCTDMWEKEIPATEVERLWRESETEQTGYTRDVHEIIMAVEDDPDNDKWDDEQIKQYMYRVGDVWTSIPAAFEDMTLSIVEEEEDE